MDNYKSPKLILVNLSFVLRKKQIKAIQFKVFIFTLVKIKL